MRHIENARRVWNERGLALPLAVMCLLTVTGLALTFLTVSAIEPQISANHARGTQARYAAEAGLEWGFDYLVRTPDWNALLAGATGTGRDITPGAPWAATTPDLGTFAVTVRNDWRAADVAITGVPRDASPTTDANNVLLVTVTGSFRGASQTITAAVRKGILPATNAAVAFPGVRAGLDFARSAFTIDGTDANLDASAGSGRPVYGISVAGGATDNEAVARNAVAANTQNVVRGLSVGSPSAPAAPTVANAENAVASDGALTSSQVTAFVEAVKLQADVTIDVSNGTRATVANVGGSCADVASRACWGTPDYPKIVYVKGGATGAPGLDITGDGHGTGVLIVESAQLSIDGPLRWNGPIILTGHNVALRYGDAGSGDVFGAVIINELAAATPSAQFGSAAARPAAVRYSREALDLVERGLHRRFVHLYSWREH